MMIGFIPFDGAQDQADLMVCESCARQEGVELMTPNGWVVEHCERCDALMSEEG